MIRDDIPNRNVFISWTGNDAKLKDQILMRLEPEVTCLVSSGGSCSGDFMRWSMDASKSAGIFLLVLTENLQNNKESVVFDEINEWRKAAGDEFRDRTVIVCPGRKLVQELEDRSGDHVFTDEDRISCVEFGETSISENKLDELYNKVLNLIVARMRSVYLVKAKEQLSMDVTRLLGISEAGRNDDEFIAHSGLYISRSVKYASGNSVERYDDITDLLRRMGGDILFITAPGGAGKSSYIGQIFDQIDESEGGETKLVFAVSCAEASRYLSERKSRKRAGDPPVLWDFLKRHFTSVCGIGENFYTDENFRALLEHSEQIIVVFDALDEVPNASRSKELADAIAEFYAYMSNKLQAIVTDRTLNNADLFKSDTQSVTIRIATLEPFDDDDIREYCEKFSEHLKTRYPELTEERDFECAFEKIGDLDDDIKRNPLMLEQVLLLFAFTGEIRSRVVEILGELVDVMFKRETRKAIFGVDDRVPENLLNILSAFAYERHLYITGGKRMSQAKAVKILEKLLGEEVVDINTAAPGEIIKSLLGRIAKGFVSLFGKSGARHPEETIGLSADVVSGNDLARYLNYRAFYDIKHDRFCHARYGEYFVARYYCNAVFDEMGVLADKKKLKELMSHCGDEYWKDIINFFVQMSAVKEIAVPEKVTKLTDALFAGCPRLERVSLGEHIGKIPHRAFLGCDSLRSVKGGAGVEDVSSEAFKGCAKLETVDLFKTAKWIGDRAFAGCTSLKKLVLPHTRRVGHSAFRGCSGITSASFSQFLNSIGGYAFCGCTALVDLALQGSLTGINEYTFEDCKALRELHIPDNVTSIGDYAFSGCAAEIIWGDMPTITEIGRYAFAGYAGTSITIPGSVTSIEDQAFAGCESLESLIVAEGNPIYHSAGNCVIETATKTLIVGCNSSVIPDDGSVTRIGEQAFAECSFLTAITIPDSVKSIGEKAFLDCYRLVEVCNKSALHIFAGQASNGHVGHFAKVVFKETGESRLSATEDDFCFFWDGETGYLVAYYGDESELVLPEGFTAYDGTQVSEYRINQYAFCGCDGLTKVTIPGSAKVIEKCAFRNCTSLTSVTIPNGVTSIGGYAFEGCTSLTSVTIGNSVTSIGSYAFRDCTSLTSVTIPDGVTSIGSYAFKGCDNLQYNEYDNALYLGNDENQYVVLIKAKDKSIASVNIYDATKIIYQSAFAWCTSLTSVTIPDSVTSIGYYAFRGCAYLESMIVSQGNKVYHSAGNCIIKTASKTLIAGCCKSIIPNDGSVADIGKGAFADCSSLTGIVIPAGVINIGSVAFIGCTALKSLIISDTVTKIGDFALARCISLESLSIPNSVVDIGLYAFLRCDNLSLDEFDNALYIGNDANPFLVCIKAKSKSITSVDISASTRFICSGAFDKCTSLIEATISEGVSQMGCGVFSGCTSLASVVYKGTMAQWDAIKKWFDVRANDAVCPLTEVKCSDGKRSIFGFGGL